MNRKMRIERQKVGRALRARRFATAGLATFLSTFATGCTYHHAKLAQSETRLAAESKALTTAVVEVLNAQPASERSVYTATALEFAKQDQRLEGFPLDPFDVPALMAGFGLTNQTNLGAPTTKRAMAEARQEIQERFAKQDKLVAARERVAGKLQSLGVRAEEERNERITRWTKLGGWSLGLAGAAVALFVFCPVALPIAGRFLGWVVGKLPGLASAFGVVSVRAFDAVVRGIERTKKESAAAPTISVANTSEGSSRRDSANFLSELELNLSREMDGAHKALVRSRKQSINA